ncbi:MAG: hypothetical protein KZQ58_05330 [gamma proteobacterium symbiont of Bathyaustriella thionipta]|nr:hypothetical protein [gamma proteobacterium symbiont of Bathyaustriella thionipta]
MVRQFQIGVFIISLLGVVLPVFAADDYLDALEAEAAKVNDADDTKTDEGRPYHDEDGFLRNLPLQAFEEEMEDTFAGTYSFYRKLQKSSQGEVFDAYKKGATVEQLRRMIMNRFSHDRLSQ